MKKSFEGQKHTNIAEPTIIFVCQRDAESEDTQTVQGLMIFLIEVPSFCCMQEAIAVSCKVRGKACGDGT